MNLTGRASQTGRTNLCQNAMAVLDSLSAEGSLLQQKPLEAPI